MEERPTGDTAGDAQKKPEIVLTPPSTGSTEPVHTRVCPNCNTVNPPASVYCYKCGSKLPDAAAPDKKICPGCNTPNSATAQYCFKCGLPLPEKLGSGDVMQYGGFWVRLVAYIIDYILLSIVSSIISSVIIFGSYGLSKYMDLLTEIQTTGTLNSSFWEFFRLSLWAGLAGLVIIIAYNTIAIGKWGKTIGKAALGLKVVKPDGSRVGYWRAFGRSVADYLNWFTLGLSFLIIAFTAKKRGLHDYIADTIVIKK